METLVYSSEAERPKLDQTGSLHSGTGDIYMRILSWLLLLMLVVHGAASAQNFSGDARKIGMGGIGYSENIATRMIEDERRYSSVLLPLGFIQAFQDRRRFDPNNDNFDPVLMLEYAANPIHYVLGRNPGGPRGRFVEDLRQGKLSRNLNTYRGFVPTNKLTAEGLASPNWGRTFKLYKGANGTFHGFYVGAGPYLSAKTVLSIDKGLTDVLSSPTDVAIPIRSFLITDGSIGQLALAVTGGYRGRIAWPGRGAGSDRDGIYLGANYHYLRGFRYEAADMAFKFETDSNGLLIVQPTTVPARVDNTRSHSGTGLAIDVGVGAVVDHWEFGFGANGLANRIDWKNLTGKSYSLQSLTQGGAFVERGLPAGPAQLTVKLPVEYTGNGGYHRDSWSVVSEVSRGFQGSSFHAGFEYRLGWVELRGGGRYGLDRWHPTGGVGLNLSRRVSLDVAAFGTTTNIERQMRPALAVSFRFNHGD